MDESHTFGTWLKRRRKLLDLTQPALADRIGCAAITLRRLEADDLRPSHQIAERLAEVLGIPAADRSAFVAFARDLPQADDFTLPPVPAAFEPLPPAAAPEPPAPVRVPVLPRPATPLIGRTHTLAAAATVLLQPEVRLVTLIGPPGVGKTRLALHLAHELAGHFADGAVWVPLAPLTDPQLVGTAIADALNLPDGGDDLADRLAEQELLLVLDNMEHVVAAAPLLGQLLQATTRLRLLVTSRVPLRLSGEHEFVVPPLALPDVRTPPAEELRQNPAVALFCARACAVRPDWVLDEANAPAVAAICQRLDGLPLAIELVAMRVKVFGPQALLSRIEQRLPLVGVGPRDAPARQQTIEAAIAWSYDLLTAEQQQVLAAMSVFAGGWTVDLAAALATRLATAAPDTSEAVLDTLTALVDQSLIQVSPGVDGEPRFTLLEIIRAFAQTRLAARGLFETQREDHARIFLALAKQGGAALHQADQPRWLARLDQEIDNFRSAIDWSLSPVGDPTVGLGIAGALYWWWWATGRLGEGRRWLGALLQRVDPGGPVYAQALIGAGGLAFWDGDFSATLQYCDLAITEGQQLHLTTVVGTALMLRGSILVVTGAPGGTEDLAASADLLQAAGADGVWYLGFTRITQMIAAMRDGDLQTASSYGQAALELFRRVGQAAGIGWALSNLGDLARLSGDRKAAGAYYTEGLALMRGSGLRAAMTTLQHKLGYVVLGEGDVAHARSLFNESLAMHRAIGDRSGMAECLYGLASVATVVGDARQAARLAGLAETLEATTDMPPQAADQGERQHYLALARAQLAVGEWDRAAAAGRLLTVEQILAENVSATRSPTPT